jgi:hypothetical protein
VAKMFTFDPGRYAEEFRTKGFVHIPGGLTKEFYQVLARQVDDYLRGELLKNFAIGDKQQALYQFPDGGDYHGELVGAVAGVCGVGAATVVLSERHIKAYEPRAVPDPPAHKDRFATEFAVGFSVRVPEGSTLVLYPEDDVGVNPFNSSTELRASLRPGTLPEQTLRGAKRVEIRDAPGDVILFRGRSVWHLRARPAGTVMLYLKLNTFNADPLGEDPATDGFRRRTADLLGGSDEEFERLVPVLGRRLDYVHRRYDRDWREVIGVVLWGEKHLTIDEEELRALRAIDGRRTVGELIEAMGPGGDRAARAAKLRYLASRGAIDLLPAAPEARGQRSEVRGQRPEVRAKEPAAPARAF